MSSTVSNSIAGNISFGGLGNGTDFSEMVTQLKKIEEIPKNRMTVWKSEWEFRILAMEEVMKAMSDAKATLKKFDSVSKMLSVGIDTSKKEVATASIAPNSNLEEGNYTIKVEQTATPSLFSTQKIFEDKNTIINDTGTDQHFTYTYKGTTREIACPSGTTLEQLVTRINNDGKNPGVGASLLKNGDGYVFQVQSKETGDNSDLHINSTVSGFDSEYLFTANDVVVNDTGINQTLTYHYKGQEHSVTITAGMTGKELIEEINTSTENIGLKAELVSEGSNYKLQFRDSEKNNVVPTPVETNLKHLGGGTFPATDTIINSTGTLQSYSYQYHGKTHTVQVADDETLEGLVTKINDDPNNPGVKASLGTNASGEFYIKMDMEDERFTDTKDVTMTFTDQFNKERKITIPAGTTAKEFITRFNEQSKNEGTQITASLDVDGKIVYKDKSGKGKDITASMKITTDSAVPETDNILKGTDPLTISTISTAPGVSILPGLGGQGELSGAKTIITDVDGSIDFDYKGNSHSIAVPAGTTAEEYITLFNAQSATTGVKAELVGGSSGYSIEYKDATTNEDVILDNLTTDIDMLATHDKNWYKQKSQDAIFFVNGWAQEFTSSSNTLTEVIIGMEITIKTPGEVTLSVVSDSTDLKANIVEVVDAINLIKGKIKELSKVDEDKSKGSPDDGKLASQFTWQMGSALTGNYGVQMLTSELNRITSGSGLGFQRPNSDDDTLSDLFTSLSQIGIGTVANPGEEDFGLLRIDDEELAKALEKDPAAIASLFSAKLDVTADATDFVVASPGVHAKPGNYDVSYTVEDDGTVSNVIINGAVAESDPAFPGRFTVADMKNDAVGIALQFNASGLTPGDYTNELHSKQGKVNELIGFLDDELRRTDLKDEEQGTLPTIISNYTDIIKSIDAKIARETRRIEQWEKREKLKYARLDATLVLYNAKGKELAAMSGQPQQ